MLKAKVRGLFPADTASLVRIFPPHKRMCDRQHFASQLFKLNGIVSSSCCQFDLRL